MSWRVISWMINCCNFTYSYMGNVRATSDSEKAGGFDTKFSCQRALQDAFCGLFYFPVTPQMDQSWYQLNYRTHV